MQRSGNETMLECVAAAERCTGALLRHEATESVNEMILVFGGAYQGKREFAEEQFGGSVFECAEIGAANHEEATSPEGAPSVGAVPECDVPDFSADIVCGLENFTWACCTEDPAQRIEAKDWMMERREEWQDKVLIITDVSQGIVPMDARTRAFREMNGRLMLYLAAEAEEVWRVFCGIGKRIR